MLDTVVAPSIINYLIVAVSAGILSYFLAWYRSPRKEYTLLMVKVENLCDQIEKLHTENKLIKKCLIIKAKMIDEQTKRSHPQSALELEEIVREMLKSNGN